MKKEVNQKEYAALVGQSESWVSKRLKAGKKLPGVSKIKNFGRFKVLVINDLKKLETMLQK